MKRKVGSFYLIVTKERLLRLATVGARQRAQNLDGILVAEHEQEVFTRRFCCIPKRVHINFVNLLFLFPFFLLRNVAIRERCKNRVVRPRSCRRRGGASHESCTRAG